MQIGQANTVGANHTHTQFTRARDQGVLRDHALRACLTKTIRINCDNFCACFGDRLKHGHDEFACDHHKGVVDGAGQIRQIGVGRLAHDFGLCAINWINLAGKAMLAHKAHRAGSIFLQITRGTHQCDGAGGEQGLGEFLISHAALLRFL